MKKLLLMIGLILASFTLSAQEQTPTYWETNRDHSLKLNYNLLGRHYAQGVFYGAAGYGAGMWLSENNIWAGVAGAFIATNVPILFEKRYDEPEVVIGRNAGAMTVSLGFTIFVEVARNKKASWQIHRGLMRW